ncbi:hypothetical protein LTR08_002914 [Meristemomyces frigidus]|nr:hypothetical protein LTR08_002914 [Meristemomyces frigidus]
MVLTRNELAYSAHFSEIRIVTEIIDSTQSANEDYQTAANNSIAMDANERQCVELPQPGSEDDLLRALTEQMDNNLRIAPYAAETLSSAATSSSAAAQHPTAAGRQQRTRAGRFSDADHTLTPLFALQSLEPIAVRSRDGTRWLPAPEEQTRVLGSRIDSPSETAPAVPAEVHPHACDAAICAVTKLFETTELLELVLSVLQTRDVMNVRLTNRHWNSIVQHSPLLRLHFFYYPQFTRAADDFQLLPLSTPGLDIGLGAPIHLGRWIHVSFTAAAASKLAPQTGHSTRARSRSLFEGVRGGLGSMGSASTDTPSAMPSEAVASNGTLQYEDLFITQPPVLGMQAFLVPSSRHTEGGESRYHRDSLDDDDEPSACAKLSCDAGITLGFLAGTAQSLLASHRSACGDGEARVVFKAIVSFCKGEAAPRKRGLARSVTRIG